MAGGKIRQERVKLPRSQWMDSKSRDIYRHRYGSPQGEGACITVAIWYIGDEIDADNTYSDWYLKENNLGKYANQNTSTSESTGVKKASFGGKIARIGVACALAALSSGGENTANHSAGIKKPLPKPKSTLKRALEPSTSGAKKSLLSEKKSGLIKKARPAAAESRGGLLSRIKSGQKEGLLGGKMKRKTDRASKGGLLGKNSKSGGLLGGSKPAAPKKSGGLLGGSKSAAPKKSGGLLGGGMKKSGGMSIGKKRR